ncbi:hypothetical protein [Eudoraea chungangensis]|uniref:hypothetical protein n=1 Tax=Eudoraea chungangensis TaxID=1481905 RepID=UPI0023ED993C|nr:hypothetical protein [Eudoraea chungangensis]
MDKRKDYLTFMASLDEALPIEEWPLIKTALWWAAKGNWNKSHNIAQDLDSEEGAWIHAYLHRMEGDKFNAGYWYRRANKPYPDLALDKELEQIINTLLF